MKTSRIISLFTVLIIVMVALVYNSCKKDNEEEPPPTGPVYTNGEGEIGPIGGTVKIEDPSSPINGASVQIPAGALSGNVTIKISKAPIGTYLPGDSSLTLIKMEPAGLVFQQPVTLGIPYTKYSNPSNLTIFYYNPDSLQIFEIQKTSVDATNKVVYGKTDHFSYYTVMNRSETMDIEMLNINGKLGARVKLNFLEGMPTKTAYGMATGLWNAWEAIKEGADPMYSVFLVKLYREGFWRDKEEAKLRLYIERGYASGSSYLGAMYKYDEANPRYTTEALSDSELEDWFSGKPLIFNFSDVEVNSSKKYFVKVQWALASHPRAFFLSLNTPIYEFNNEEFQENISQMASFSNTYQEYLDAYYTGGGGDLPTVTTNSVSNIQETTATCGGNVTDQGSSSVTAKGVCWSTSSNPTTSDSYTTDGSGTGSFTSNITGLTASTTYYVRAYATNSAGTAYGNQQSFTASGGGSSGEPCPGSPTITDPRDLQVYQTVLIGNQCWLQENMNYETGNSWCYDNNPANCDVYGRLYDWDTFMNGAASSDSVPSGVQGVCPTGWHVPSDEEWKILEGTIDTQYGVGDPEWNKTVYRGFDAGKHLKSTFGWFDNGNGDNSSGFTTLPGGARNNAGWFNGMPKITKFWSSTESSAISVWSRHLHYSHDNVGRYDNPAKIYGYSARCLQD